MTIKYTFLFAVLVSAVISGCNNLECVSGSGNQVTQEREVETFTAIEVGGAIKLVIKQDSSHQLRVVADDNIQERIDTRVRGNTLFIDMDGSFCETGPITVYANANNLSGVSASGAVEVISDGKISSESFELNLSGASKVMLDLNTGDMRTDASGSTDVKLTGQARSHKIDISGAGEVNALNFIVGDYRIRTSGSSDLGINVLNNLDVESSGASEISYKGNPKNVSNRNSGSSSLNKIK